MCTIYGSITIALILSAPIIIGIIYFKNIQEEKLRRELTLLQERELSLSTDAYWNSLGVYLGTPPIDKEKR